VYIYTLFWQHVLNQYGHLQASNIKFINRNAYFIWLPWILPFWFRTCCQIKVYNIHYLVTSLLQSTQQDDKHKYLFVHLFTRMEIILQQRVLGQNLLCLCLRFLWPVSNLRLSHIACERYSTIVALHWNC
jgi:hypothetical protein